MPGIVQDNLMFPILELIRDEIRRYDQRQTNVSGGADPFEGTPSSTLYREHPADPDVLTRVFLEYPSGYTVDIILSHGLDDGELLPLGFDESHPDWEFVTQWKLSKVRATAFNTEGNIVSVIQVKLNYDDSWRLIGTTAYRIY